MFLSTGILMLLLLLHLSPTAPPPPLLLLLLPCPTAFVGWSLTLVKWWALMPQPLVRVF